MWQGVSGAWVILHAHFTGGQAAIAAGEWWGVVVFGCLRAGKVTRGTPPPPDNCVVENRISPASITRLWSFIGG